MEAKKDEYLTYNVLARKPLIWGVPVITLVALLCLMLLTGFAGVATLGMTKGLIFPALLTILLFFIRIVCIDNSRAMESLWWDIKGTLFRLRCQSSIVSFTSTDDSIKKRRQNVIEWFKNNTVSG